MEISVVNSLPDVITIPKIDIIPGPIEPADKQQMQPKNQGLPEYKENVPVNEEQINKVLETANKSLAVHNIKLEFSIHEKTKEVMLKVLDWKTGEVLNEIPSAKSLDRLAMEMDDIGWLVDKKA